MASTILIRPIVTEKSMQGTGNQFTFLVTRNASKVDIKKAIKESFGVTPISIRTNTIKGKRKRIGVRRVETDATRTKKATVILKKGDKLSIFESEEDQKKKKKNS